MSGEDSSDNALLLTDIDSPWSPTSDNKGPPINPHLAKIIDQRLLGEIDRDKQKNYHL